MGDCQEFPRKKIDKFRAARTVCRIPPPGRTDIRIYDIRTVSLLYLPNFIILFCRFVDKSDNFISAGRSEKRESGWKYGIVHKFKA